MCGKAHRCHEKGDGQEQQHPWQCQPVSGVMDNVSGDDPDGQKTQPHVVEERPCPRSGRAFAICIHSWRQDQAEQQGEPGCPPNRRNYRFGLNEMLGLIPTYLKLHI